MRPGYCCDECETGKFQKIESAILAQTNPRKALENSLHKGMRTGQDLILPRIPMYRLPAIVAAKRRMVSR